MLDVPHRAPRLLQQRLSLESVKRLYFFQRVFFHASPHALLERLMQIHQHSGAQHPVDLVFARRMHSHQPLQRSRLVRPEVIHMHLRIGLAPPRDFVHQPFKAFFLLISIQSPSLLVTQFAVCIPHSKPEQILQSLFTRERITLQIQENIASRRLRQSAKTSCLNYWQ